MVRLHPYFAAKSWYSLPVNCLTLSLMTSSGIPNSEKQDLRVEITSLDDIASIFFIHGYCE